MYYNEDDRAQRLLDVFEVLDGQINVSYVNSTEHIVAWHKHDIQSDYWTCIKGSFKVGIVYSAFCISPALLLSVIPKSCSSE